MAIRITSYDYTYGAGTQPNRRINFIRNGPSPTAIYAQVKAYSQGNWFDISDIPGDQINVEMMSTFQKIQAMQAERAGRTPYRTADVKLSTLNISQQDDILHHLEPEGSWRIAISNEIGSNPRFEQVAALSLFNTG